VSTSLTNRIK